MIKTTILYQQMTPSLKDLPSCIFIQVFVLQIYRFIYWNPILLSFVEMLNLRYHVHSCQFFILYNKIFSKKGKRICNFYIVANIFFKISLILLKSLVKFFFTNSMMITLQQAFTCSILTKETPELCVKSVSIVDFD